MYSESKCGFNFFWSKYIYDELLEDFTDNVESIYDGSFFERVPLEDNHTKLKNNIK